MILSLPLFHFSRFQYVLQSLIQQIKIFSKRPPVFRGALNWYDLLSEEYKLHDML